MVKKNKQCAKPLTKSKSSDPDTLTTYEAIKEQQQKIAEPYKADRNTLEGKYRHTGHTHISKYYE